MCGKSSLFPRLSLLLAGLLLVFAVGCDESAGPGESAVDAIALPAEYDSLHDLMEDMERHYKYLKRNAADGEPAALLQRTAVLRELTKRALAMTPKQVTDAPEDQKDTVMQTYRDHLENIGPAIDDIENAIADNNRDALAQTLRQLHEVEEEGHEALGVEEDHHDDHAGQEDHAGHDH